MLPIEPTIVVEGDREIPAYFTYVVELCVHSKYFGLQIGPTANMNGYRCHISIPNGLVWFTVESYYGGDIFHYLGGRNVYTMLQFEVEEIVRLAILSLTRNDTDLPRILNDLYKLSYREGVRDGITDAVKLQNIDVDWEF